jgi:hypothetical protein
MLSFSIMPKKKHGWVSTHRTVARACPACGRSLNAATGVSLDVADQVPEMGDGDITTCAYCGAVSVVTGDALRLATDDDLARLPEELRHIALTFRARSE